MEPDGIRECPYCGRFFEVPEVAEVVRIRARLGRVEALAAEWDRRCTHPSGSLSARELREALWEDGKRV